MLEKLSRGKKKKKKVTDLNRVFLFSVDYSREYEYKGRYKTSQVQLTRNREGENYT